MVTASRLERPDAEGDLDRAALMVRTLSYLVVFGVIAGFLWSYRQGYYRGLPFPHNSFLFIPSDHFRDLLNFSEPLKANDPYSWVGAVYPPFAYIVMEPFSWVTSGQATVLWTVIVVGGLGSFVAWELDFVPPIDRAAAVVALTVCSYPFLFSFDRGNIEAFITLLLAAFVWALQTGRRDLAAVAVGTAAAIKGYPLIFAALFLVWRQWRPLIITAATAMGLTFVGSVYYGFNLPHTISLLRRNLHTYNEVAGVADSGLAWGCSLFGPVKLVAVDVLGGDTETVRALLPAYLAFTAVLGLGLVIALWRLPLRFWEQITLLVLALNLLPTVSADYKLLHLVVPTVLFLRYGTDDRRRWWYLVGFAALMVPKAYVVLRPDGVNIGVILNPLIMLAIGLAIIDTAFARSASGSASAPSVAAT
jgi:hypothetical protein